MKPIEEMTREEKIAFLKSGQQHIGQYVNYDDCGDFSDMSNSELDMLVEELDWIWK